MKGGTRKQSWITCAVILIALQSFPASAAEPVRSVDIVESSAFLEGYRAASEAQSADFYDLYSDRAVIHAHIQGHDSWGFGRIHSYQGSDGTAQGTEGRYGVSDRGT